MDAHGQVCFRVCMLVWKEGGQSRKAKTQEHIGLSVMDLTQEYSWRCLDGMCL